MKETSTTQCNLNSIRPLSFISLSHSNNQSESATKFYNSFKPDVARERADTDLRLKRTEI